MANEPSSKSVTIFQRFQFFFILLFALILVEIPVIALPLKWFETFFHEISHGLAAIATGGNIVSIELNSNGSGLCTTQGGNRFVVSFMGYTGASIFGFLLIKLAQLHQWVAKVTASVLALLVISTLILWCKDLLTAFIITVLLVIILLKIRFAKTNILPVLVQLIGAAVLLNSIKSPFYLFDGQAVGDGATLANITLVPETIWVAIWCGIGMITLYLLVKTQVSYIAREKG